MQIRAMGILAVLFIWGTLHLTAAMLDHWIGVAQ